MAEKYYIGQGRVAIADLDANKNPQKLLFVGNVPEAQISFNTEVIEHFESQSGRRQQDRRRIRQLSGELTVTLEEVKKENLALLFWGTPISRSAGSVTDEVLPSGLIAGDTVVLKNANITASSVVITDSDTPPASVASTDYTVDAEHGTITFTNVTGYTQPFKVDYSFGSNATIVPMITDLGRERFFRFHGLNIGNDPTEKIIVELYRVIFDPVQNFALLNEEYAKFELKGSVLADPTKEADPQLGQFGRIILLS